MKILLSLAALCCAPLAAERRALPAADLQQLAAQEAERVQASRAYLETNRFRLRYSADDTFEVTGTPWLDEYGTLHVRFQQLHRGVPVRTAVLTTHLGAGGEMLPPTNRGYGRIVIRTTTPAITAADALEKIREDLAASNRALAQMPATAIDGTPELMIDPIFSEPEHVIPGAAAPDPELNVTGFRLIYRALVGAKEEAPNEYEFEPAFYFVDAASGRILRKRSAILQAEPRTPDQGTGYPVRRGRVPLNITKVGDHYELFDLTRGAWPGNRVRSMNNTDKWKYKHSSPVTAPGKTFGNGQQYTFTLPLNSETANSPAADVAWAIERTWDVLGNVFGHKGIDGKGTAMDGRVHSKKNYSDANFNSKAQAAYFGDGVIDADNPSNNRRPNIGLTTVAHEFGHGLWSHYMPVDYEDKSEAAGLNEGHGDILGAITNFYTHVSMGKGGSVAYASDTRYFVERSYDTMSYPPDPWGDGFGGFYGRRYYEPGMKNYEEHIQGCAYGHMFVILVEGASNDPEHPTYSKFFSNGLAGIGMHKAAKIWFQASTAFAPDGEPTFGSMRNSWLKAAEYIHGKDSMEYRAVTNAWAAIGLGSAAQDGRPPQVTITSTQLDETEGSLILTAAGTDDTGAIVEFGIDGKVQTVRRMAPHAAVLSLRGLSIGKHTAFARVTDMTGKSNTATKDFTLKGVNNLIADGSFENGCTGWLLTSTNMCTANPAAAFLGNDFASFRDNGQVAQHPFKIPANATKAALTLRYRVVGVEYLPDENLFIDLWDGEFNKKIPLKNISSQEFTLDEAMRHYKRLQFDVTQYKGKNMVLVITSALTASATRFVIDAVGVTYTIPESLTLTAELDEPGRVLRMRATPVGIDAAHIKSIGFRVNGSAVATDYTPYDGVTFQLPNVPDGTYNVQAFAVRGDNSELPSNIVPITFTGKKNQVANSSFEQGAAHWILSGVNSFVGANAEQSYNAHTGNRYGGFVTSGAAGSSSIRQLIAIPKDAQSVTVSFYLKLRANNPDAGDVFRAKLVAWDNSKTIAIAELNGSEKLDAGNTVVGYTRVSKTLGLADLQAVKGKTMYLEFSVTQNGALPLNFYVDDASVYTPVLGKTLGN